MGGAAEHEGVGGEVHSKAESGLPNSPSSSGGFPSVLFKKGLCREDMCAQQLCCSRMYTRHCYVVCTPARMCFRTVGLEEDIHCEIGSAPCPTVKL